MGPRPTGLKDSVQRIDGLELSLPATQATTYRTSCTLAGQARPNLPHAGWIYGSEGSIGVGGPSTFCFSFSEAVMHYPHHPREEREIAHKLERAQARLRLVEVVPLAE